MCPLAFPLSSAQGWLRSRPAHESEVLWGLFDKTFESVLTFVGVSLDAKMQVLECNFIKQVQCMCSFSGNLQTSRYPSKFLCAVLIILTLVAYRI